MDRLDETRRFAPMAARCCAHVCAWGALACLAGCSLPFGAAPRNLPAEASGEPLLKPAASATPAPHAASAERPDVSHAKAASGADLDLAAELKQLEHLDPATKAKLAADLREVDREFWPYLLLYYRDKSGGHASALDEPQPQGKLSLDRMARRKSEPTLAEKVEEVRQQEIGQQAARREASSAPNQAAQLAEAPLPPATATAQAMLGQPTTTFAQLQAAHLSALAQSASLPPNDPPAPALDWRGHLQAAITELERQTPAPGPQAATIEPRLRLLYLAADRGPEALEPCAGLSEGEQQFWSEELFGLSAALDQSVAPAERRHTLAARHLRQAATQLGQQGLLDVRNVAFCSQVDSYGIFKRVNAGADEFQAGQEVLLYAEIENFSSKAQPEGFHTSLASRYEIANEQGEVVARHEFPPLEETCRNVRRDFFLQHRMWIPKNLPRGRYRLRLVLTDNHAQKQGEASLPFAVRGE